MMVEPSRPLRQPGFVVYLSGLGTSLLALGLVEVLNRAGTNIMGWYANGVIPVGALIVGMASGAGYAVASRYLQVKLGRGFILSMVLTAMADYLAAQYLTWLNLLDQHGVTAEQYPFSRWIRDMCEKMSFSKNPGSELGIFGYVFKLLEVAGYVAGATVPSLIVSNLPYCRACQKYLKKHRTAWISSPTEWSSVKALSKAERGPALEAAIAPLYEKSAQLCQSLAAASLSQTDAILAGLQAQGVPASAAHIVFTLLKCPDCDAHLVRVELSTYTVDKQFAKNTINTLDKIEQVPSKPST
jgi:hypothetical protein